MIISEKQIMQLMEIARRYHNLSRNMNFPDQAETAELISQIMNQQPEELKVINK